MQSKRNSLLFLLTGCIFVLVACEDYDDYDDEIENGYGDEDVYSRAAVVGTYQAEDHTFQKGCRKKSEHSGYTGSGFMDYGGNGSMVEWNSIKAPLAGQYKLTFRYANASDGDRRCSVTVNDTNVVGNVAFGKTGAWTTWKTATITVTLRAGNNTIRVTANTGSGGPNLDKMDLMSEEGSGGGDAGRCVEVAERESATLSCPSGQVITKIGFASYGMPTGSCSAGFSTGTCHASTSKTKVQSLCLNKRSCSVGANNDTFGDPCPGTGKKMAIKYSCSSDGGGDDGGGDNGGGGGGGGGSCGDASEGGTATLTCSNDGTIASIGFASYGLPKGSCSAGYSTGSCHASTSKSKVQSLCQGRQSCKVGANNGTFGDPCPGTPKKLAIVYSCTGGGDDGGGGGGGETSDDCKKNGISGSKHPDSKISFTDTINWSKHLVNNRYNIHVVATGQISDNQMRQACEGLSHMVNGLEPAYTSYMKGLTVMIHANPRNGGPTTGAAAPWFIIDREAFCSTTTPTTGSVTPNTWKTFVHEAAHSIAGRIPGCDSANENYFPNPSAEYWSWRSEDWFGVTPQQTRDGLSSSDYNHLKRWYRTSVKWDAPNYCNFND